MVARKRYSYTVEVVFSSEDQKALFCERVESMWQKLEVLEGSTKLNDFDLLSSLLAIACTLCSPATVIATVLSVYFPWCFAVV